MKIEQIYTGCLAEAAYYIESKGEAAIVDPLREVEPYIEMANKNGAKIKYVLETHFHADFVSGHLDLAKKTGASIVYGPTANPNFEAHIANDDEILNVGDIKIKVLHTPGHTMESSTFLLIDEDGQEHSIFTGDTLFIGDVGRPDLAVKSDLSREDLAGHLYDSLHNKIFPLQDNVIIYPGHGAGSACGKKMSDETTDTLGNQKKYNYALQDMTKEEFVTQVTEGLVAPPQYFPKNAVMNKMGYESIDDILERGLIALSAEDFKDIIERNDALILDTRKKEQFVVEHIPGSIWIGIEDSFAPWVGALVEDLNRNIVFLADEGLEEEVVTRLSRVGYDHAIGFLKDGIESWKAIGGPVESLESISAETFAREVKEGINVLDVRKASEYDSQHLVGAENFPLDFINKNFENLEQKKYYLHCQGGYRSVIAASFFQKNGFKDVVNVEGGFREIKKVNSDVTEFREPETML